MKQEFKYRGYIIDNQSGGPKGLEWEGFPEFYDGEPCILGGDPQSVRDEIDVVLYEKDGTDPCDVCQGDGRASETGVVSVLDRGTKWQRTGEMTITIECPACAGTGNQKAEGAAE